MSLGRGASLVASLGPVGHLPRAPATAASLLGALAWRRLAPSPRRATLLVLAVALVGGACARACITPGDPDPQRVVVDELAGVWLALAGLPPSWPACLAGGFAFRLLDRLKPGPVAAVQRLGGAGGVMADDLLAGALANLLLRGGLAVSRAR
ncbi:MAG: phosphatidylglycerophosphatase A [Solirubrobacterales bacterium]|nr:phosphatidylglycerophosphatase A [Solirubrobacterales bacterium]